VDGVPITEYCAARRMSIEERIRLFRLVCEAVQYAHQNLVVHRDLKPSNILTTREGVPKLLDFGIATVLDPSRGGPGEETLTRTGLALFTPHYASPEQVRRQRITTASDIYSLGTVLFELLSGQRAHQFASESVADMQTAICDVEPVKPSVAAGANESLDAVSRRQLRRRLSGDLDNIILTAIRKDPQRRYASVADLS
jgi:eukaryotic-like serine/threonine-protein kinase